MMLGPGKYFFTLSPRPPLFESRKSDAIQEPLKEVALRAQWHPFAIHLGRGVQRTDSICTADINVLLATPHGITSIKRCLEYQQCKKKQRIANYHCAVRRSCQIKCTLLGRRGQSKHHSAGDSDLLLRT